MCGRRILIGNTIIRTPEIFRMKRSKLVPTERGTARYNANPNLALHYDDNDNWPPRSPVAMWFDDTILDDFLKDWAAVQKMLYAGEITQAEYFEWKIMWPSVL